MLLGHWYLNAPGMELAPLRRLLDAAGCRRRAFKRSSVGSRPRRMQLDRDRASRRDWLLFVVLRWSFGLVGVLALFGWRGKRSKFPIRKVPRASSTSP